MRICILGAGALGSAIGGYLARSGVEVVLIGRAAHVEAIRHDGLRITGVRGDIRVRDRLNAVRSPSAAEGSFDFLILLVKGKDTAQALQDALPLRDRVAVALSLQNDYAKDEHLRDWIGAERVVGAVTVEGATLVAPGHVDNHLTTPVTAYFGEFNGQPTPRVNALTVAFCSAGLSALTTPHIEQVRWEKLTQIASASGWSASTLAALPELCFADGAVVEAGAEHFVALTKELLSVYKALGYSPQNYFAPISRLREIDALPFREAVQTVLKMGLALQERGQRSRTSMHEDILHRRKTESDEILKPFLDKAVELNLSVPTVAAAYRVLKVLDHYMKA